MTLISTLSASPVVPVLSISVGPVILISGVGLLLLSLTNRYGRVIDRARFLADNLRKSGENPQHIREQIGILRQRARLIRASITFATLSVLCTSVLVIGIFIGSIAGLACSGFIVTMFCACLLCLIVALICFLLDINRSLAALDLDLQQ